MTVSRHTTGCLEFEELAAFVDGRITSRQREQIEAHLVTCEPCYDLLAEVTGALAEIPAGTPSSLSTRVSRSRPWMYGAVAVAATLLLTVWLLPYIDPMYRLRRDVETVVTAGADRPFEVRLVGETTWRPVAAPIRGRDRADRLPAEARIALVRIDESLSAGRTATRLSGFGRAQLAAGRLEEGIAALEESVAVDPDRAEAWADLAAGYIVRSRTPERAGDLPRALEAVDRALSLDATRADYQFNRAIVLEKLNLKPQAIEAWEAYLAADPESGWAAEARERLSRLRRDETTSDAGALRDHLLQCFLPVWAAGVLEGRPAGPGLEDARAIVRAIAASTTDPYANDVVESLVRASGDRSRVDRLLRGIVAYGHGRAAYMLNRYDVADMRLNEARLALEHGRQPLAMSAVVYRGVVAYRSRRHREGHALLQPVGEAAALRNYSSIVGRVQWTRGLMWLLEGRLRESAAAYRAAVAALSDAGEPANAAFVLGLLATNYDRLGDPVRMWQARVQALQGSTREGTLLRAAGEARRQHWPRAAREFADAALRTARRSGQPVLLVDALRWQAIVESELGEHARAEVLLEEARRGLAGQAGDVSARLAAEVDLAAATIAVHEGDAERGMQLASGALAYFSASDPPAEDRLLEILLTRARLARRIGLTEQARADLEQGLEIFRRRRHFADAGVDQATLADVARRMTDELVAIVVPTSEEEAFHQAERVRAWDLTDAMAGDTIDLATAREQVPEQTVIASYVVGETETYLWSIRRGRSVMATIPAGRQRLAELVRAFHTSRGDAVARQLSDLLVSPLRGMLANGEVLAVVADGPLHLLPFGALYGSTNRYLVESHPVLLAPSVTFLIGRAGPRRPAPTMLAIGNPAFARDDWPELADLPGASLEAASLVKGRPGAMHLFGEAATRSAVVQHLGSASIVHFAGHAVVNEFTAAESALVLAGRDRLTAGEVRQMRLDHVALVVLASCESARGFQAGSGDPMGLARAFHAAGVPSVVASLRVVDDDRAQAFFGSFHSAYSRGLDPARALQAAQVEAIVRDRSRASARHWGSYVLTGSLSAPAGS